MYTHYTDLSIFYKINIGPVAQTGRALPLQGRGPGFKSRWVHFNTLCIIFIRAALFLYEICVKGKFVIIFRA